MNYMHKLKSLLLYAGLSKEDFQSIYPLVNKDSNRQIRSLSFVIGSVMFFLFLSTFFMSVYSMKRYVYLGVFIVTFISGFLTFFVRSFTRIRLYILVSVLLIFGIILGTMYGLNSSVTAFCVIVIIVPQNFTDVPLRLNTVIAFFLIPFIYLAHKYQTQELFESSCINVISFTVASFFLSTYTMVLKFRQTLLEYRHYEIRKRETVSHWLDVIADIYICVYYFDFIHDSFIPLRTNEMISSCVKEQHDFNIRDNLFSVMKVMCKKDYQKVVHNFCDVQTLSKRMHGSKTITHEFEGVVSGWCRARFIDSGRDDNGDLTGCIFMVEQIQQEKEKENYLKYLSETDLLTGITNRGAGEMSIRKLLDKGESGLFIMFDIDKFKNINDTYGHAVGDKVIVKTAEALKNSVRDTDICLRLGGDEFAAFLKNVHTRDKAEIYVDRLFKLIKEIEIPGHEDIKIEVSLGAVICQKDAGETFEGVYKRSDAGCYTSKKTPGCNASFN